MRRKGHVDTLKSCSPKVNPLPRRVSIVGLDYEQLVELATEIAGNPAHNITEWVNRDEDKGQFIRLRDMVKVRRQISRVALQGKYLECLKANDGHVMKAAVDAGIPFITVKFLRSHNPEFARMEEEILEMRRGNMEQEAYRRAVHGVDEPVYQGGELVGYRKVYSDKLLEKMLTAEIPEKYDRKNHGGGNKGVVIQILPPKGIPSPEPGALEYQCVEAHTEEVIPNSNPNPVAFLDAMEPVNG